MLRGPVLDFLVRAIWLGSLTLAGLGLLLALGLVVRRARLERQERRRGAGRQDLQLELLARLEAEADAGDGLPQAAIGPAERADMIDAVAQVVQGEARRSLAGLGARLGVRAWLLERVTSPRPLIRADTLRRLALFDDDAVTGTLRARLADRHQDVRIAAAEALIERAEPEDIGRILAALGDPRVAVTGAAIRIFQDLARNRADAFLTAFDRLAEPPALVGLCAAAARVRLDGAPVRLATLARHEAAEVRRAAVAALGRYPDPEPLAVVEAALADADETVRGEAAKALARMAPAQARPRLRALLKDASWRVRQRAAELLGVGFQANPPTPAPLPGFAPGSR